MKLLDLTTEQQAMAKENPTTFVDELVDGEYNLTPLNMWVKRGFYYDKVVSLMLEHGIAIFKCASSYVTDKLDDVRWSVPPIDKQHSFALTYASLDMLKGKAVVVTEVGLAELTHNFATHTVTEAEYRLYSIYTPRGYVQYPVRQSINGVGLYSPLGIVAIHERAEDTTEAYADVPRDLLMNHRSYLFSFDPQRMGMLRKWLKAAGLGTTVIDKIEEVEKCKENTAYIKYIMYRYRVHVDTSLSYSAIKGVIMDNKASKASKVTETKTATPKPSETPPKNVVFHSAPKPKVWKWKDITKLIAEAQGQ